ncbi:oligosaccharide flippase family protein [Listeria newyorkensis]|uniref:Oligosaccharide flippase family protein n=1 Tax=Listeria newyorkensis TaxID=1497681 RepID=A0A841YZ28_9LIST|nr:polysaccharide biosynthesis C-terminal domain-containing protein [Listeria newyorkensis]MBC1457807.1 oligosaccharide flippase family protein [Listeria newyorkensis]
MSKQKINYILMMLYQFFMVITPLMTTPYVVRVLGPEKIGEDAYANSFVQMFLVFVMLGIASYGKKIIAMVDSEFGAKPDNQNEHKKALKEEFGSIFGIQFVAMWSMLILYLLLVTLFFKGSVVFYLYGFMIIAYGFDISWYFIARGQLKKIMTRTVLIRLVTITSIFLLVKTEEDLWIYVFANCFLLLLGQVYIWFFLIRELGGLSIRWGNLKKHVKPILVLAVIPVSAMVYISVNRVVLGAVQGEVEVGYYNQAYKLYTIGLLFVQALAAVLMPRLVHFYKMGEMERFKEMIAFFFRYICASILPVCLGVAAVSTVLIHVFLGAAFMPVVPVIVILILSLFLAAMSDLFGMQIMVIRGQNRAYAYSGIIGSVASFGFNLFIVTVMASEGTALAFLVGNLVIVSIQLYFIRDLLGLKQIIKMMLPYLLYSLAMMACILAVPHVYAGSPFYTLVIQCVVGLGSYVAILFIRRDEILYYIIASFRKKQLSKDKRMEEI